MSDLRTVPTLDELAADPGQVSALPADAARVLFVRVRNLEGTLLARLLMQPATPAPQNGADHFLGAAEVAAIIGKSRSWVEKNTEALPARRKVGGEAKWSEREVQTWMRHRELWA